MCSPAWSSPHSGSQLRAVLVVCDSAWHQWWRRPDHPEWVKAVMVNSLTDVVTGSMVTGSHFCGFRKYQLMRNITGIMPPKKLVSIKSPLCFVQRLIFWLFVRLFLPGSDRYHSGRRCILGTSQPSCPSPRDGPAVVGGAEDGTETFLRMST